MDPKKGVPVVDKKAWLQGWKRFFAVMHPEGQMLYSRGSSGVFWGQIRDMLLEGDMLSIRCNPLYRFSHSVRKWVLTNDPKPIVLVWHKVTVPRIRTMDGNGAFSYTTQSGDTMDCVMYKEDAYTVRIGDDAVHAEPRRDPRNVIRIRRGANAVPSGMYVVPRGATPLPWSQFSQMADNLLGWEFHMRSPEGLTRGAVRRAWFDGHGKVLLYLVRPEMSADTGGTWERVSAAEPVCISAEDVPLLWRQADRTICGVSPVLEGTVAYAMALTPPDNQPSGA